MNPIRTETLVVWSLLGIIPGILCCFLVPWLKKRPPHALQGWIRPRPPAVPGVLACNKPPIHHSLSQALPVCDHDGNLEHYHCVYVLNINSRDPKIFSVLWYSRLKPLVANTCTWVWTVRSNSHFVQLHGTFLRSNMGLSFFKEPLGDNALENKAELTSAPNQVQTGRSKMWFRLGTDTWSAKVGLLSDDLMDT